MHGCMLVSRGDVPESCGAKKLERVSGTPDTSSPYDDDEESGCGDAEEFAGAPLLAHKGKSAHGYVSLSMSESDLAIDSSGGTSGNAARARIGINASWAVNIVLLIAKVTIFALSRSYAVLASAMDSLVDLLSQGVLAVAERQAARHDERYPIGRTRLAEMGVLCCGCIMLLSTVLVIQEAGEALWQGFHGDAPVLQVGPALYGVLGAASMLKLGLWLYCRALRHNPIMVALAEDHLNDVLANIAAICGAAVAGHVPALWFADPLVAIAFSVIIIRNWIGVCWEQAQKLVGVAAPGELVEAARRLAVEHHPRMLLDRLVAYHHGSHVVVEAEVVLPYDMRVAESSAVALQLQHKLEALEHVERAFVTVDCVHSSAARHKVERNLRVGHSDVMRPMGPPAAGQPWGELGSRDGAAMPHPSGPCKGDTMMAAAGRQMYTYAGPPECGAAGIRGGRGGCGAVVVAGTPPAEKPPRSPPSSAPSSCLEMAYSLNLPSGSGSSSGSGSEASFELQGLELAAGGSVSDGTDTGAAGKGGSAQG